MAKHGKPRRTGDKHIEGIERIDAPPEDIARALFKRPVIRKKGPKESRREPGSRRGGS